jgi:hypothetical protein
MRKFYTFVMPVRGTQEVWLEAESDEEAWAMVRDGDWEDSDMITHESFPDQAILVSSEKAEDGVSIIQ